MKYLLAFGLVLVLASTAFALGDNPQVYAYVSFDAAGDPVQNVVAPAPYTTVNAYICLGCVPGGMTTVSFLLNNAMAQCPGVMATQAFVNLLPGGLAIGDAFVNGITLASTECMLMDPVVVGHGSYFYLGGDCCIEILDHVDYPRWVVDCNDPGLVDLYCLEGHGIVGAGVCVTPLESPCPCDSPVEDATWGGIKALYR
ncbi:MAG: hypothetical protein IMY84_00685 [Chloroflexi bacterium]|nr:hypothetical protein [Chloroflexota bacterium]